MEEPIQKVRETTTKTGNTTQTTQEVIDPNSEGKTGAHAQNVVARLIGFIAAVLLVLLGLRFVLALLGANPGNGFAHFIYSASHPFVAPFFSLFSYSLKYGISHFETFTLVAMVVYALVAGGLMRLVTINRN